MARPVWLRALMSANPLYYALAALRRVLYPDLALGGLPALELSLAITLAYPYAKNVNAYRSPASSYGVHLESTAYYWLDK